MPRTLTIKKIDGKPGEVYYPLELKETAEKPVPGPGEVLVRIRAAALNHRDHFIRQHLYPAIGFGTPLLADGVGIVEAVGPPPPSSSSSSSSSSSTSSSSSSPSSLLGKRVLLTPSRGWAADPHGPEDDGRAFAVAGGTRLYPDVGYARDWIAVPEAEVELCPEHLSDAEAAALPLVGLTAWRAVVTKANLGLDSSSSTSTTKDSGRGGGSDTKNVLVTGIGGGVAIAALQFLVAFGCNVWVTSSSPAKIARAVESLGAKGGVSYRNDNDDGDNNNGVDATTTGKKPTTIITTTTTWDKKLAAMLPRDRPYLDAVIDGAGGDVVARTALPRLLRAGGVIVSYGMTVGPRMDWLMAAVLRNVELRGTTMGSRAEFGDMVAFVRQRRVRPVVSRVAKGLDNIDAIEALFADIREGRQFGKLVIEISSAAADDEDEDGKNKKADAKL